MALAAPWLHKVQTLSSLSLVCRAALFGTQVGAPGRVGAAHVPGRGYAESDATAGLDNGQLVLQQRDFMKRACTHAAQP